MQRVFVEQRLGTRVRIVGKTTKQRERRDECKFEPCRKTR